MSNWRRSATNGSTSMAGRDQVDRANARAAARRAEHPTAVAAWHDRRLGRIMITLSTGLDVGIAPGVVQGLEKAKPADLSVIEISPSGLGLHFPKLDADLYLPALLQGIFGSKRWIAAPADRRAAMDRTSSKASASISRSNTKVGRRARKAKIA